MEVRAEAAPSVPDAADDGAGSDHVSALDVDHSAGGADCGHSR
jgi:hypothetical protein